MFKRKKGLDPLELLHEIEELRRRENAVILAHYYQRGEIQQISDFIGDSFQLAEQACKLSNDVIVVCGARFMAETVKILNPTKTVLSPAPGAECPMARMIRAEDIRNLRNENPDAAVLCYVNSCTEVKAESDVCCTSSSAVEIAKALPQKKILFLPDRNLCSYTAERLPEKQLIPWNGYCPVHTLVGKKSVETGKSAWPDAKILVHPECTAEVRENADFIGSTAQMIEFVGRSSDTEFIIGTEIGVMEFLQRKFPEKSFHPLSRRMVCTSMRQINLNNLRDCLRDNSGEIRIPQELRNKAYASLRSMITVLKGGRQ